MEKKYFLVIFTVLLIVIMAVSSLSSVAAALSPGTYADHQDAMGETVIDVQGHPLFVFDGYHYDSGDLGAGDVIRIWRQAVIGSQTLYVPVAIITDIPQRVSLFQILYGIYPTSIQLISDTSVIETMSEGKSKNIHIAWKTDLVVPDEYWGPQHNVLLPGFTIPAGMLILRGHGDVISGTETSTRAGVVSQVVTWTGYFGNATLVCSGWNFGGPVGVNEGKYRTNVRLDGTVVTTIY